MKNIVLIFAIQISFLGALLAQEPTGQPASSTSQPKDNAWEFGIHAGHVFTAGNIKFIPGYGGGIHIRRALDYVFSLRLDLLYGSARGEDEGNVRSFDNSWTSGTLQALVSLNNLKWALGERKTNIYAFAGFGLNSFSADLTGEGGPLKIERDVATQADLGAGIAFRISPRLNFGVEHKAALVFGDRADMLDGVETLATNDDRTTFRDVLHYTSIRLNINLGSLSNKTEPLYWVNPMEGVITDITRLKDTRVSLNDTDADGVIDMLDEEENTPAGAAVNPKGVTLDSDGDGIADYQDKEPFSQPGYKTDAQGVAQVPDQVAEMKKYVDEKLRSFQPASTPSAPAAPVTGIYLPSLYFQVGSYKIANQQHGTLSSIAQIMKANPGTKFVVAGHADGKGSEATNNKLSYNRANAVINVLAGKFKVPRNQIILTYKGEAEQLVDGYIEVNRRVEFKVASGETEMPAPK
ncbi:MAG: OmpA family protein [Bacteroidota bacterium]